MNRIYVKGMHGLGDNINQRTIIEELLSKYETVYLETPWPGLYSDLCHDLENSKLVLLRPTSKLRTQQKNMEREAKLYGAWGEENNEPLDRLTIGYTPDEVRKYGGVLRAMCHRAEVYPMSSPLAMHVPFNDYSAVAAMLKGTKWEPDQPLCVFRPLTVRPKDWGGCGARNPDHEAYFHFLQEARKIGFFMLSVADLQDGYEWTVGPEFKADETFHNGDLTVQYLLALVQLATVTISAPGFMGHMSRALFTPTVTIFGGYENSKLYFSDPKDYRKTNYDYLGIDPIIPCDNFAHVPWPKEIDLDLWTPRFHEFLKCADEFRSLSA